MFTTEGSRGPQALSEKRRESWEEYNVEQQGLLRQDLEVARTFVPVLRIGVAASVGNTRPAFLCIRGEWQSRDRALFLPHHFAAGSRRHQHDGIHA